MKFISAKTKLHISLAAALVTVLVIATPLCAFAGEGDSSYSVPDRIYGQTRYETSIEIANEYKKLCGIEKFENIVVAYGENYPDALSGGYLAIRKEAPILLVSKSREAQIRQYIEANLAEGGKVYILGGTGVVSTRFELSLKCNVERLGGPTRFETNLEILKAAGVDDGCAHFIFARGYSFADALCASATGYPVMLATHNLTDDQLAYVKSLHVQDFSALNGEHDSSGPSNFDETLINSDDLQSSFGTDAKQGWYLLARDRYIMSELIAESYYQNEPDTVILSYGENFPDSICAAPLAAKLNAPLLLVSNGNTENAVEFCSKKDIKKTVVLGGPAIVSDNIKVSMISK